MINASHNSIYCEKDKSIIQDKSLKEIIEGNDVRKTAEEMDKQREKTLAYEYLCHLEEAKKWIEVCIKENLPPTTELEENLRNGVYLAKLGHFIAPEIFPSHKIYDSDQQKYQLNGLQFRHTDNINYFLQCLQSMELPFTFQPETTDIYDKKNMPRLIYCIHALSTHLFKLGKAPKIQDLYGKINFTDEEIDAVSKELRKYGIQMPSFQKIGGLLTNSIAVDVAALHAAVIAINKAVTEQNQVLMISALQDKAAQLNNICTEYAQDYLETLYDAKDSKRQAALNRSLNDSYVPDAYDELLTQAEIQGHINHVNVQLAGEDIVECIQSNNDRLIIALKAPALHLQNITSSNIEVYIEKISKLIESPEWKKNYPEINHHWQHLLQNTIDSVNDEVLTFQKRNEALRFLNDTLLDGGVTEFYKALKNPYLKLTNVDKFALPLYYEEMKIDLMECGTDLTYNDIVVSITVLSAIAAISKAVDEGDAYAVYDALKNPDAHVMNLIDEHKMKYFCALESARLRKLSKRRILCNLLTYNDIQDCIKISNEQYKQGNELMQTLTKLNAALADNNPYAVTEAFAKLELMLRWTLTSMDPTHVYKLLKNIASNKKTYRRDLYLSEVEMAMIDIEVADINIERSIEWHAKINDCLDQGNLNGFMRQSIMKEWLALDSDEIKQKKFDIFCNLRKLKLEKYHCPFVTFIENEEIEAYLNIKERTVTWDIPEDLSETHYVTESDAEYIKKYYPVEDLHKYLVVKECMIIKMQARIRGYLLRKKYKLNNFNNNKIIKIQAWWRGILQRKRYIALLNQIHAKNYLFSCQNNTTKLMKTESIDVLDIYRDYEPQIIKIQALWRGRAARRAFNSLLHMEKPPFPVVRHFSAILNFNAQDYDKDLQLQHLKHEVVQIIRHNQNLSQQLDSMDIKIGLLIQNRITLQDVVTHGKSLENLAKQRNNKDNKSFGISDNLSTQKGLKSLTKEGRKKLEGYQHLFYTLQTNPSYLSKLLFLLPQSKTNKFLQNVILTLFNFGSNIREEYLLLKLFGSALQEEIRCKFQKPSEVVTGDPLVLKLVVNYARQLNGQRALRQIVGPLIENIISDKTLAIETNPVDAYKCWRNQLEMETGETQNLPYTVSHQEALTYEHVRKRLNDSVNVLKKTALEFLTKITESRNLIPYGMLYVAKVLNDTLREKFPNSPEKDILKVVGNLIYYQFINAAIVAPDAFDIITLPVDRTLLNDQRRNLACIAKILQFAASKKGFGEEATHLNCLNPFIIECHEKFKKFFRYCCQIEDLEEHFNIHEYTEATLIHKPEIYISLQEICDTHCLMLKYQDQIAPDPLDPLHDLLEDLESAPTVASLLGISDPICEGNLARLGKTEVCLVLTNKFQIPEDEDTNLSKLFIKTKELLVSVLQFLKGPTLVDALAITSPVDNKILNTSKYSTVSPMLNISHKSSSLNDCKFQLSVYLNKLRLGGWVSKEDGYQNIITAVAKDLCNKGKYRIRRNNELKTLQMTKQSLEEKTRYYQEQVEYYNKYIQKCLENLHTGKGSIRALHMAQKDHRKLKSKMTLKYSAAKLQEKGVLLEVDGLPLSQWKNVLFEISPTEHNGLFIVHCKFMGVNMEKVNIDIQKLLELQYEGSPIMDMFGKAKINVNLLLYLLNKKFYGKI
ncbi:ras GTPase-activating-like protein IQGAP1 isoform X1 [Polistes fuscatus]|uniref:ras GTPase-activating-like protein IQGAP1 isoform X1 n=1 Tax=Polistes fuscatus TaxID=30207 RepID=UPI001CA8DC38|nr:ras GTPase-activating-like protein IQGAP1 isoform X1 [Polistes fuscatus]